MFSSQGERGSLSKVVEQLGAALQTPLSFIYSLIRWLPLFLLWSYSGCKPKLFNMVVLPVVWHFSTTRHLQNLQNLWRLLGRHLMSRCIRLFFQWHLGDIFTGPVRLWVRHNHLNDLSKVPVLSHYSSGSRWPSSIAALVGFVDGVSATKLLEIKVNLVGLSCIVKYHWNFVEQLKICWNPKKTFINIYHRGSKSFIF